MTCLIDLVINKRKGVGVSSTILHFLDPLKLQNTWNKYSKISSVFQKSWWHHRQHAFKRVIFLFDMLFWSTGVHLIWSKSIYQNACHWDWGILGTIQPCVLTVMEVRQTLDDHSTKVGSFPMWSKLRLEDFALQNLSR